MDGKLLTAEELDAYVIKWRMVFSVFGLILLVVLFSAVAFGPSGLDIELCYAFGSISSFVCLYAAKKLRDVERARATLEAQCLLDDYAEPHLDETDVVE